MINVPGSGSLAVGSCVQGPAGKRRKLSDEEVNLLAANLVTDLHPESLTSVLNKVSANLKTLTGTVVGMTTVVTTVVVRARNAQVAVDGTRANAASRYMMIE